MDSLIINKYLEAHKNIWAPTTLRSETFRLNALAPCINGNPHTLLNNLDYMKPYSRLTAYIRVAALYTWAIDEGHIQGPNPYTKFKKKNRRLFANAYTKETLELTYDDARKRIEAIQDEAIRRRALELLGGAQRWCESGSNSNTVIGKGGKARPNFAPRLTGPDYRKSYSTFYKALKQIGLKPHTLRKLALTRLVDKGATEYDLMAVAGWSSIQTASSYVQAKRTDKLKEMMNETE